jgi:hypothetical protein
MSCPAKKEYCLYKGADFTLSFRISVDGAYLVPETDYTTVFRAMPKAGEASIWEFTSGDSPFYYTNEDNIQTLTIPGAVTDDVTEEELYYELDTVDDAGGIVRRMIGTIVVFESAA